MAKFTGTLSNGFEYEVDTDVLTNMRFLDMMVEATEDGTLFTRAVRMLFGVEQREALYTHIEEQGKVPTPDLIGELVGEIMMAVPEGKN